MFNGWNFVQSFRFLCYVRSYGTDDWLKASISSSFLPLGGKRVDDRKGEDERIKIAVNG